MFPSKAERILSRFRPIAPKPLPLPPSGSFGTTDPSSTCASVESFTSSAKCKKSRKRRADDSASAKGHKAPKSMGSGLTNTGGASSLTQGASDGAVPLGDLRSGSQISHGSMAFGKEDLAPIYVSDVGNMLPQHGVYLSTDVNVQQQHAFSLLHQNLSSGNNCNGGGLIEKDVGFMERAAAAVPPERSVSVSMCDSVGGKGVGYVGGGFTEMIRGITRLPTVADVQSLMQVRVSPSVATGPTGSTRSSPTGSREIQPRRPDHLPLPPSMSHCLTGKPLSLSEADQACESDAELTTLSLLPNVPSRTCSPGKVAIRDGSPSAQRPIHGVTHVAEPLWHQQISSRLEPPVKAASPSALTPIHAVSHVAADPWHHLVSSRLEASAKLAIQDVSPSAQPPIHGVAHVAEHHWHQVTHAAEPHWNQQVSSRIDPSAKAVIRDGSPSAQPSIPGVAHVTDPCWHQPVSSRLEPSASLASRSPCLPHVGVQLASGIPFFSLPSKKPTNGLIVSSMNLPSMGMASSPVMADGRVIDEVSLEQVYGGSTDPVLLLDDNNQVLWFNKPYDKALKSASERLSGKTKPAGPYIDPLGHPTPLCSFVLPVYGKPSRATLWGFLKKLVMQENELPLSQGSSPGPSSQLQLCVGEGSLRMSPARMESNGRMGSVVCASNSRLTTLTLESITEFHMDVPTAPECVEAAEARLGAGSEPAFITDWLNRVRWVNAALKQMLGHINFESSNRCSGASGNSGADVAMSSSLEASSAFAVCCTEKIPRAAWAFSCRVNLEWMKGSKRRSMTVPCDVSRLACTSRSSEVSWVWQFDMAVSLCLNVPS